MDGNPVQDLEIHSRENAGLSLKARSIRLSESPAAANKIRGIMCFFSNYWIRNRKMKKLGANAMKRVDAGRSSPDSLAFEPAKRLDDRAGYCLVDENGVTK